MSEHPNHKSRSLFSSFSRNSLFALPLLILVLFSSSCSLFKQAKEYERFVNSRFAVRDVKVLSIAGIDVSQKGKISDLNFSQMISLGLRFVKGDLPSVILLTVQGQNTAHEKAAISGMDWLLQAKSDTLATGVLNQPVTIPPGETILFPVKVNFNLSKLLKSGSLDQMLKIVLGDGGKTEYEKLGLVLKIKPWYRLGSKIKKSPVYLSIHPEFGQLTH